LYFCFFVAGLSCSRSTGAVYASAGGTVEEEREEDVKEAGEVGGDGVLR
jgi:hypothetical protein